MIGDCMNMNMLEVLEIAFIGFLVSFFVAFGIFTATVVTALIVRMV